MKLLNGKPILLNPPDMTIYTDAAKGMKGGWGATCLNSHTGGPWKMEERNLHINILELLAAEMGLKTYLKGKQNMSVHLKLDNTTALSHLAKMGVPLVLS